MKLRVPKDANMEDYYGVFWETPKRASLLPGHIKLIEQIAEFVNLTLVTKGYEHFTMKPKGSAQDKTINC